MVQQSIKRLIIIGLIAMNLFKLNLGQGPLSGNSYVERQLLCALDQGPCDVLGSQIKGALPEIIGRNCQNCDQRQVANARRIARFVQAKYPDVWNALVQKYTREPISN